MKKFNTLFAVIVIAGLILAACQPKPTAVPTAVEQPTTPAETTAP